MKDEVVVIPSTINISIKPIDDGNSTSVIMSLKTSVLYTEG